MLENQFIKITRLTKSWSAAPMPVPAYSVCFFVEGDVTSIAVVKSDNTDAATISLTASESDYKLVDITELLDDAQLAIGERFILKSSNGTRTRYSSVLVSVPEDGFASVQYRCNEDAFGFPFSQASGYVIIPLPIRISKPQYSQKDETYEKLSGEVVTLYAKHYKEWDGETDFLSESMHDKIIAALSCDEVYINGTRVTKTDNYSVNWDEYDIDCNGETKLARATFKVRANVTQRNSNY